MSNPIKTYILAPTREVRPDTAIQLGNIISDPQWPEESVINDDGVKPLPASQGPFHKVSMNYVEAKQKGHEISQGVFAEFLQYIVGESFHSRI